VAARLDGSSTQAHELLHEAVDRALGRATHAASDALAG
jgi:hypothetical protein